jgi:voltage-gated potassium channel
LNISVLALLAIFLTGIIGYTEIEGFTVLEAFYMTVITISTVGFSEVHSLSESGRLFTAFLIITSFGIFAYAIRAISSYIFTGEFRNYFKDRKLKKTLHKLNNHVIICGYGRNGKRAAEEFRAHNMPYVVIEEKEHVLNEIKEDENLLFIHGDSTRDEILEKAHISSAQALIATLPIDADNLLTVLTAREMNKQLLIISRASNDKSYSKLKLAGANNVIMPDKIGGAHMASLVLKPDVIEFFDQIIMQDPNAPYLKEVICADLSGDNGEHTLEELRRIKKSGVTIIGTKNHDGTYTVNPPNDRKFSAKSKLFVLGTPEQIKGL